MGRQRSSRVGRFASTCSLAPMASRVQGSTKGDRSRVVSLDEETVTLLREHRTRQIAERLRAGALWNDTRHVFASEIGTQLNPARSASSCRGWSRKRICPVLAYLTCDTCTRRLCCSRGVPVDIVAERLGHADPSITWRIYSHIRREHMTRIGTVFADAAG